MNLVGEGPVRRDAQRKWHQNQSMPQGYKKTLGEKSRKHEGVEGNTHRGNTREQGAGCAHSQILVRHFLAVEGVEQELAVLFGVEGQDADAALLAEVEDWLGDLLKLTRKEDRRVDVQRAHGLIVSLGYNGSNRRGGQRRVSFGLQQRQGDKGVKAGEEKRASEMRNRSGTRGPNKKC